MKNLFIILVMCITTNIAHAVEITVRAQDFIASENVASGAPDGYGDTIITRKPGNLPTSAKYKVTVKAAGNYQLSMTYAASVPRPISITVNGQQITGNATSSSTGGWFEGNWKTKNEGRIPLKAGENSIVFSRSSDFPHLHAFTLEGPN